MQELNTVQSCLVIGGCVLWQGLTASATQAQIIPDRTLPNPSRVTTTGNTTVITEGSRSGSNLFHSFRAFSVSNRGTASFNVAPEIENIFTRVTGSTRSDINGAIEVLQADGTVSPANLFLLNPNGILFRENASLNIGGSFLATTAGSFIFSNGTEFSAVNPRGNSLLTVSVPIGLQFGQNPGTITNRSLAILVDDAGNPVIDEAGDQLAGGLQVRTGEAIALVGGRINVEDGIITASSGQIDIGSVGESEFVSLTIADDWRLEYNAVQTFQDIQLVQFSILNTSGDRGGSIQIHGDRVSLTDESEVLSETLGNQNGENIFIQASQLVLDDLSLISSSTPGTGQGGNITIRVDQLIAQAGGGLSTATSAEGVGGNIDIVATEFIVLSGAIILQQDQLPLPSGFFSQAGFPDYRETGNGGNITISTPELRLEAGAQISASTFGTGNAGTVRIQAERVELSGVTRNPDGSVFLDDDGLPLPVGFLATQI
ncbi:MAG: filamentous hemagglutinin N-terminal domain-containing protein [Leptolyngbyaceae cyanobacterium SL_7_1]|nr:filamentous hemagglutinin N-terminal domain-containing protein [Leptolyngbyaceae cyanobacterium SL_7_1]